MRNRMISALLVAMALGASHLVGAADGGFTQFIASLWPEAQAAGVSRAVFDAETRGLEPDYKLPDLILPGRPATGAPSKGKGLRLSVDLLEASGRKQYLAEYAARIARSYPPQADGKVLLRL